MSCRQDRLNIALIQLSTDCNLEIESELSKSKIQKLINDNKKIIKIKCEEFDKYGRLLGSLYDINNDTESFNKQLIEEGYAYEYDGGTKTKFNYDKYIKEEN